MSNYGSNMIMNIRYISNNGGSNTVNISNVSYNGKMDIVPIIGSWDTYIAIFKKKSNNKITCMRKEKVVRSNKFFFAY